MKKLSRWFLDNPVAANLLMAFILVAGLLTFQNLRVESFPQIPPTEVEISVVYPGGTARQVDESITQRIEEAISGVAGIKRITSQSSKGYALLVVKKNTNVKLDRLIEDIRNQVESIEGFPVLAERPRIYRSEYTNLAAFVMVYGGDNNDSLQQVSLRVERALKKHPAISKVTNLGKRKQLLAIEPDPRKLQRYGLSLENLTERIRQWSVEYRSGELRTANGNIVLQGSSLADNLAELRNIPIITKSTARVRLSDIATVKRDYEQTDSIVRYQGQPAIALMVSTSQKDNLFHIHEATKSVLESLETTLPKNLQLDVMADMFPYISEQLDLLSTNALQGLFIVLLLLVLFLDTRLAFWVALGIPLSLAGAITLMGFPSLDYSINDITIFGMILVLGILVDDAVVVGESIHQARQNTTDTKEAAWKGVEAVAVPTVFGVLTTIAAFSPMLWIENELAKVLSGFSAVVIFALIFSLIESKFILPAHLSYPNTRTHTKYAMKRWIEIAREKCNRSLNQFSDKIYIPLLSLSLANRKTSISLFAIFLLLAYGAMFKGHIASVFFPEIPGRYATVKVTMQHGVANTLAERNTDQLEQAIKRTANRLQQEYGLPEPPVSKYIVSKEDAKTIELTAELTHDALARVEGNRFLQELRLQTGILEGSYAVKFSLTEEPAGDTAIAVSASNRDQAKQVADRLKASLVELPGVNDVYDDSQLAKRQLKIMVNERGASLGIDQSHLASVIGGAFGQIEIHRLLDNGEETLVLARLPQMQTKTIEQLKATPINLGNNSYVSLGEIAQLKYEREPEVIYRRDRDEVVSIYWRQNRSVSSPEKNWERLKEELVPELERLYPGVQIKAVGEFSEIVEVQAGFKKSMLLTLLLIYVLLAIPLKSYWQPVIIMSVIPMGFAGAIIGHGLLGFPVSLLSLFGMMAMTGVVINDSLVLMSRFNQLYTQGVPVKTALLQAGKSRVRAIFLTTVTTICGLLPLLAETSEQAQYLKPAAISLVFGELFATPITLILIPLLLSFKKRKIALKSDSASYPGQVSLR
ncbi:efflux RND transporter permease subunit [Microbulbifer sp. VAAC004]|uniref:efflux RND transporter permease subunit n=1 Tax=unclassified Microbulbifer TaxID=2619833 RepID=UPI00403B2B7C